MDIRKLRPAKVRNAVRRRWFERRLEAIALTDAPEVVELGSAYGGWRIPAGLIEPTWLCYSVGVGGDISFDLESDPALRGHCQGLRAGQRLRQPRRR